jgi:hypothetical protein
MAAFSNNSIGMIILVDGMMPFEEGLQMSI